MKTFLLVDYKGKADIIVDELDTLDYQVGTITKEEAIRQAPQRIEDATYYGIPAYCGDDEDLKKIYK